MIEVLEYLAERQSEFDRHIFVARALEARVDNVVDDDASQIEVRHVNTVKSGLLIHLYNIVEATTVRTLEVVGQTIVTEKPKQWRQAVLKEWVRSAVWDGTERLGDGAVARLVGLSAVLASGDSPEAFRIKGEPGSWDDEAIKKVADRLGCQLVLPDDIRRAAYEQSYRNEMTAMKYLASRRNAIAHGATTFEEGAHDHTLDEISELAGKILPYLKAVTESYQSYLNEKVFLEPVGEPA